MHGRRRMPAPGARSRRGRTMRSLAVGVSALAAFAMSASVASAHTWNLANDFALSPNGVTAPANPFPDSYTNGGVWAAGYGGGGTYSATVYSGLTSFTVAPASDWLEGVGGVPGAEAWRAPEGYPYTGVNSTASSAYVWPAESVFMHPATDTSGEQPRAAVRWVSPVTGTISIEAAFSDEDCGGGDGSDYSVDVLPTGSSTFTHLASKALGYCGSGSYNNGAVSVKAGDAYYFSVGDGGNASFEFDTTGVSVTIKDGAAETLSISSTRNLTATYKHAIAPSTVSGHDTDGDTVTLSASNVPAGLTFNAGTGTLSGTPAVQPGRYVITFAANDGHGETVTKPTIVTVEKGSCTLTDKPALLVAPTKQIVSAKLAEASSKAGIAGREVIFGVEGLLGATTLTTSSGTAKLKTALPAGGVYLLNAAFGGDAYFNPCGWPNAPSEVFTVEPSTWTATGAGQVPGVASGIGKTTATFGFDTAATGEFEQPVLRLLLPGVSFFATNISSLSKPTATSATWSGSGNYNGGSAEYTITASDPSTGADTVSIAITVAGETVFSTEGAKPVKGGDAKVH